MSELCVECGKPAEFHSRHEFRPIDKRLNQCYFCNSAKVIVGPDYSDLPGGSYRMFVVTCGSCGAQGPSKDTEEIAIMSWNLALIPDKLREAQAAR